MYIWLIMKTMLHQSSQKGYISQFQLLPILLLKHKHTYVNKLHWEKKRILLNHFKTIIFNLFCTNNTSDNCLPGFFQYWSLWYYQDLIRYSSRKNWTAQAMKINKFDWMMPIAQKIPIVRVEKMLFYFNSKALFILLEHLLEL